MTTEIIRLVETDSTNRYLRDKARVMSADITVAVADYQSAGRGQGSNRWESARGENLLCSFLVRPVGVPAARQFILSMTGALAIHDVVSRLGEGFTLKWPNDVYWHDRKLSGTLIETTVSERQLKTCIFGIGLNVNQQLFTSDAPNPVSLAQIAGHAFDRDDLLSALVNAFERRYARLLAGGADAIRADYHAALYRRDGLHAYRDSQGDFLAEIIRVADDGHLLLRDTQGRPRQYAFKEVSLTPDPSPKGEGNI